MKSKPMELVVWEGVLPISGKFARVRRITMADLLAVWSQKPSPNETCLILMERALTIDDLRLTREQILEWDAEDLMPAWNRLSEMMAKIASSKAVA